MSGIVLTRYLFQSINGTFYVTILNVLPSFLICVSIISNLFCSYFYLIILLGGKSLSNSSKNQKLNNELITYNPLKWSFNLPFKNYTIRGEDLVPALSGAIGKVALVAAFALAWAQGYGITSPNFITENVRLELLFGSLITIFFCAIFNPYAAPPGTLAPLIPLVPVMVAAGVHPLPLGILIGLLGIIVSFFKFFDEILLINKNGAKGGIILLFGLMGLMSSSNSLKAWTIANNSILFPVLLILGIFMYLLLGKLNLKWLMIPVVALSALSISALFGFIPEIKTVASFPIINPRYWWFDMWGLGWGISVINFVKAAPFALLAVVMWPTDAIAIKTLQEANYPKGSDNSIFNMTSTFIGVSFRNAVGAFLGGAQTSAIWRSFMIPLSIVKRPIGGSALLLGIIGIAFALLGFPLDVAVFPPLIWLVLIFGVFIPLVEIGLNLIKTSANAQVAGVCILLGLGINPVIGWVTAILIENFNLVKDDEREVLNSKGKITTLLVAAVTLVSYLVSNLI
jgi:hypothetical protein